jgi:methyltransferase
MTIDPIVLSAAVTLTTLVLMAAEARLSWYNERGLRANGAVEPDGDVHAIMAIAYPACFVAMGIEGATREASLPLFLAGALVFAFGKAIKYWAIASLGPRWTFRVLVLPRAPLLTRGPYRWLRHPNYVGVVGELFGMALMMAAPITGAGAIVGFGYLLRRRIAIEDQALRRQSFTRA